LIENPDVIQNVANMPQRPAQVVAFAAESENHIAHAQVKLERKDVDAIVANDVSNMGQSTMAGWFVSKLGEQAIHSVSKQDFAEQLLDFIAQNRG